MGCMVLATVSHRVLVGGGEKLGGMVVAVVGEAVWGDMVEEGV